MTHTYVSHIVYEQEINHLTHIYASHIVYKQEINQTESQQRNENFYKIHI